MHAKPYTRQALHHEVSGLQKQTLLHTTSIIEQQTVLLKCIQGFHEIQCFYMPGFDPRNYTNTEHNDSTDSNISSTTAVKNTKLYMPSELSASEGRKFCLNGLASIEDCIRFAKASNLLEDLRHHLHTRSFANKFKITNITGQKKNTQACEVQHHINDKVQASEVQYRRLREALKKLHGAGDWEDKLKVLEKSDICTLNERELNRKEQDEQYQLRQWLGIIIDDIQDERVVVQVAAVGEGQ
jgi:hypothetical protein